ADLLRDILLKPAEAFVVEHDGPRGNAQPPGTGRAPGRQALATRSRIDRAVDAARRDGGDLAAGACARVGEPARDQLLQSPLVACAAAALVTHRTIPLEAEALQRAQDVGGRARHLARRVEVLDAHEPF